MVSKRFLALLSSASLVNYAAAFPPMVFDCQQTPAVCTNMCWGAYCAGFDVSLEWDKPNNDKKKERRDKAKCFSGNNRCNDGQGDNPDPTSRSCDEYPFASTSNADSVQQVNRCVPQSEQNSQGGTISSYYQNSLGNQPGEFIVGFGNPDANAVQYCDYDQHCLNDGNQYCGDDPCPDGPQTRKLRKRYRYMLESGMPIVSTREISNGTEVKRVAKRSQAEMTLRARGAGDPYELVDDKIVRSVEEDEY